MNEKDLNEYTKEEFDALPLVDWDQNVTDFNSLIIVPTDQIHDSGFRCMYFVACRYNTPICRISGCSDVIHINGIGGYGIKGIRGHMNGVPLEPVGWSIDCLKTSGLLRLFTDGVLQSGTALSSFEIFSKNETNNSNMQ